MTFDTSTPDGIVKQQMANMGAASWNAIHDVFVGFSNLSLLALGGAELEAAAPVTRGIMASNGTRVTGLTMHGVQRVIGDGASRAGVRPQAILDALKNPIKVVKGVDLRGRAYEIFTGKNARVVVNPETGKIVSTNPLSAAGAH